MSHRRNRNQRKKAAGRGHGPGAIDDESDWLLLLVLKAEALVKAIGSPRPDEAAIAKGFGGLFEGSEEITGLGPGGFAGLSRAQKEEHVRSLATMLVIEGLGSSGALHELEEMSVVRFDGGELTISDLVVGYAQEAMAYVLRKRGADVQSDCVGRNDLLPGKEIIESMLRDCREPHGMDALVKALEEEAGVDCKVWAGLSIGMALVITSVAVMLALCIDEHELDGEARFKAMDRLGFPAMLLLISTGAFCGLHDGILSGRPVMALNERGKDSEFGFHRNEAPAAKENVPFDKNARRCGLCGKAGKLTKTSCCGNWICDDVDQYVMFSYARNSCFRNHDHYTLCSHHHNEGHSGDWKDCPVCLKDFETELYVWYGTNEYNFEKLPDPPSFEPTRCGKCGKVIRLGEDAYSMHGGRYLCVDCDDGTLERMRKLRG